MEALFQAATFLIWFYIIGGIIGIVVTVFIFISFWRSFK